MTDWADAQLNALTQWANTSLEHTQLTVNDVCEDLQDGLVIIALIEHIAQHNFNLKYNRNPRFPGHKLDNLTVAFKWIESNWKIKVPCNPGAILEGQRQQCMGILFLLKNQAKKLEALAEEQRKIDEERKRREEEEAARIAEEQRKLEEEREAQRQVEEAKRLEALQRAEEEARKLKAEQDRIAELERQEQEKERERLRLLEEAERARAEEEKTRQLHEEDAKRQAEEKAARAREKEERAKLEQQQAEQQKRNANATSEQQQAPHVVKIESKSSPTESTSTTSSSDPAAKSPRGTHHHDAKSDERDKVAKKSSKSGSKKSSKDSLKDHHKKDKRSRESIRAGEEKTVSGRPPSKQRIDVSGLRTDEEKARKEEEKKRKREAKEKSEAEERAKQQQVAAEEAERKRKADLEIEASKTAVTPVVVDEAEARRQQYESEVERKRQEGANRVEELLRATRVAEEEAFARKIKAIEDRHIVQSAQAIAALESELCAAKEELRVAQEKSGALAEVERLQTTVTGLEDTLRKEKQSLDEKRTRINEKVFLARAEMEKERDRREKLARRGSKPLPTRPQSTKETPPVGVAPDTTQHSPNNTNANANNTATKSEPASHNHVSHSHASSPALGVTITRKDRSATEHGGSVRHQPTVSNTAPLSRDEAPTPTTTTGSGAKRPGARPGGSVRPSSSRPGAGGEPVDRSRKYQTISSMTSEKESSKKSSRSGDKRPTKRLSQDDLSKPSRKSRDDVSATLRPKKSTDSPSTKERPSTEPNSPVHNNNASTDNAPSSNSLPNSPSHTAATKKEARPGSDRIEGYHEFTSGSPRGSRGKLSVQDKRNMLKLQIAAGRNTVCGGELVGEGPSDKHSKPKITDTALFFDDKLVKEAREWNAVFKKAPTGQVNPNLVTLVRVQALFRGKLERTFFLTKDVKNWKRRKLIAKEVLSTEEFYVQCLHFMVKHESGYWKKLSDPQWELAKHPEYSTIATIFQTAGVMLSFNELLLKGIRERMARFHQENSRVDDVFKKFVGFLKVYVDYVNKYEKAAVILRKFCMSRPELQQLAQKVKNDPDNPKYLDLDSLLIMPIQRLPRYVMLLQELKSFTPQTSPFYADLTSVHKAMADVATDVNLKKRMIENREAVIVIGEHLLNYEVSNESIRSFERQGALRAIECEPRMNESIDYMVKNAMKKYVFLFNDILLVTEIDAKEKQGLLGKANQRFTLLGLELKTLISDNDGGREEKEDFTIDELRDHPHLQFKQIRTADLFGAELIEYDQHHLFGILCRDKDTGTKMKSFFITDSPEKYNDWLFDLDRAIATLITTKRSRVSKEDLLRVDERKEKDEVLLDSICFSSIDDPEWVENKFGCLRSSHLVITHRKNDAVALVDIDILDCDISLCKDSDFPEDATKRFYFTIRKPNPENKDKPFQFFFYANSSIKRRLWVTTIRNKCVSRLKEIDRLNNPRPLGEKRTKAGSSMLLPSSLNVMPSTTENSGTYSSSGK